MTAKNTSGTFYRTFFFSDATEITEGTQTMNIVNNNIIIKIVIVNSIKCQQLHLFSFKRKV